jgi:carboxymethylenebutenolidase
VQSRGESEVTRSRNRGAAETGAFFIVVHLELNGVKFPPMSRSGWLLVFLTAFALASPATDVVTFPSGNLTLHGVLYKPAGKGPFPAVLYNHGSAPGMLSQQAFDQFGPLFAQRGWVFFAPWRRGQGLSAEAGQYIEDQITAAWKKDGVNAAATTMVRLLETEHLNDQLAGVAWLRKQNFVAKNQIAVMGNSFGGIETVLGAEKEPYCAAVDASGGAESWALAPQLQSAMIRAASNSKAPIFFFQAANDYDLRPSSVLADAMRKSGKVAEVKIYPEFAKGAQEGHSFTYMGSSVWAEDVFKFLMRYCKPN